MPRKAVHDSLIQRLKDITPPKEALERFEKAFNTEWENAKKDINKINESKRLNIKLLESEMLKIESNIDNITDKVLFERKQQRRADLNQQKDNLEYEIEDIRFTKDEFEKTYNEAKIVITDPLSLWNLDDIEIKQLVIRVCFNNKIYYRKKECLHTPEISVLYTGIGQFNDPKSLNLEMMGFEPMSKRHNQ